MVEVGGGAAFKFCNDGRENNLNLVSPIRLKAVRGKR
jgi:hypothetical protein